MTFPASSSSARTVHSLIDSPVGPLTIVATEGVLSGLYMARQRHAPDPSRFGDRETDCLPDVREQLGDYFDGELTRFTVPIAPRGSPFQQRVWSALCAVPYGQTTSYGELAALIGQPTASRAVGLANGRNPICIIIPCHRVLGADRQLTGYGGGLDRKQALLTLERREIVSAGTECRCTPSAHDHGCEPAAAVPASQAARSSSRVGSVHAAT